MPAASSAKRKAEPAAAAPGAVVWAKLKGFPAWPAQVESVEAKASGAKATVVFFGTGDQASVAFADVTPFADGAKLRAKSKAKKFVQAVAEAEQAAGLSLGKRHKPAASPPAEKVRSPAGGATGGDDDDGEEEIACQACGSDGDDAKMVLCDGCPRGYHIYCLSPKLRRVPKGDWHCPTCNPPEQEEPAQAMEAEPAQATQQAEESGVSAYEQQRLDNIARNEAMLRQLNIAPINMAAAKPRARAVRGLKGGRRAAEPVQPRARSNRLAGKGADGEALPETFKEPSFSSMSFDGDRRRHERIEGELTLADALREDGKGMKKKKTAAERKAAELEEEETDEMISTRKQATVDRFGSAAAALTIPPTGAARAPYDENATLKMLRGLTVKETDVAKVVPERIFSTAFHPSADKLLVVVGDKWGSIGFFEPDAAEEENAVTLFSAHTRPIPCLKFDPNDSVKLYSSSYDNTVRCMDVAAMQFSEVFAGDDDYFLAYSTFSSDFKTLYCAFNNGELGSVDLRAGKDMTQLVELHERKISHVAVHPVRDYTIATASNDCTVKLWDARKMGKPSDALASFSHGRAATSAVFSPIQGDRLLTTSYDDFVRVIELPTGGAKIAAADSDKLVTKIRHDNQTGRWLTNFRATWDSKSDNTFVIGSMKQPRGVDFYSGVGHGKWSNVRQTHENFTTVSSLNCFHPTLDVVAGGNSSGKISIWR